MRSLFLLLILGAGLVSASSPVDPASVLVVVQDNTAPETGTGGANAGQYLADYYMAARGIPAGNIVHVSTFIERGDGVTCAPGGPVCDLAHSASWNITQAAFEANVRDPILAKLSANGGALAATIKYIVPIYGVPITIQSYVFGTNQAKTSTSIDDNLAGMSRLHTANNLGFTTDNPYYNASPTSTPLHIDQFDFGVRPFYLVTRLDGQSAVQVKGLIDKAIAAETDGISIASGFGYFDWQGNTAGVNDPNFAPDQQMLNAYNKCVARGLRCVINNQTNTAVLITSAPDTLWAWGWYSLSPNDAYTFAPGGIGGWLSSSSAVRIRSTGSGSYAAQYLLRGATATWGVTGEPGSAMNHTHGDNLLNHFWMGYTFGEAAYISTPFNTAWHVFIGDPLYRPRFLGQRVVSGSAVTSGKVSN